MSIGVCLSLTVQVTSVRDDGDGRECGGRCDRRGVVLRGAREPLQGGLTGALHQP